MARLPGFHRESRKADGRQIRAEKDGVQIKRPGEDMDIYNPPPDGVNNLCSVNHRIIYID